MLPVPRRRLLREGLVRLLEAHEREVVSATADAEAFLASLEEGRPDVCALDVRLPPGFSDEGGRVPRPRLDRGGVRGCAGEADPAPRHDVHSGN